MSLAATMLSLPGWWWDEDAAGLLLLTVVDDVATTAGAGICGTQHEKGSRQDGEIRSWSTRVRSAPGHQLAV